MRVLTFDQSSAVHNSRFFHWSKVSSASYVAPRHQPAPAHQVSGVMQGTSSHGRSRKTNATDSERTDTIGEIVSQVFSLRTKLFASKIVFQHTWRRGIQTTDEDTHENLPWELCMCANGVTSIFFSMVMVHEPHFRVSQDCAPSVSLFPVAVGHDDVHVWACPHSTKIEMAAN